MVETRLVKPSGCSANRYCSEKIRGWVIQGKQVIVHPLVAVMFANRTCSWKISNMDFVYITINVATYSILKIS